MEVGLLKVGLQRLELVLLQLRRELQGCHGGLGVLAVELAADVPQREQLRVDHLGCLALLSACRIL